MGQKLNSGSTQVSVATLKELVDLNNNNLKEILANFTYTWASEQLISSTMLAIFYSWIPLSFWRNNFLHRKDYFKVPSLLYALSFKSLFTILDRELWLHLGILAICQWDSWEPRLHSCKQIKSLTWSKLSTVLEFCECHHLSLFLWSQFCLF